MKKEECKEKERMLEKFNQLENEDLKQGALTVMTAYISGVMEERARWEDKQKTA